MAAFRKISVTFWSDSFVGELTPEQKYFYLYLMTNDKTTQCGIYETSIRKICFDTGYNSETIQKLLSFFEEKNKIRFSKETNEIALLNWVKFNDSSSPKVLACVEKELKQVKNRVLIEYLYTMDTHPQEEEEKEEEEEYQEEQEEVLSFRDELFNKWLAYKKEKKSKYTPTGIKQLYRTWENKSDQELEEAINNSIANNYQGIFEPKKQYNGATTIEPKLGTSQARMEALKKW
jgi:tRNA nucleotidyltransferase/poly(A) polymerase